MTLRERMIVMCHTHGLEPVRVIARAAEYEKWITEGDKAQEAPRPVLTAGKTAKVEADPKR